jgi:hypothetical protein
MMILLLHSGSWCCFFGRAEVGSRTFVMRTTNKDILHIPLQGTFLVANANSISQQNDFRTHNTTQVSA